MLIVQLQRFITQNDIQTVLLTNVSLSINISGAVTCDKINIDWYDILRQFQSRLHFVHM